MKNNCFLYLVELLVVVTSLLIFTFSCNRQVENSTTKSIVIYADEICKDILEAEKTVFDSQNPESHLTIVYGDESTTIGKISIDSTRLVALTRPLDSSEVNYIRSKSFSAKSIKIAQDAVVIIANSRFGSNTILWDSLSSMLYKGESRKKTLFVIEKNQAAHLKFLAQKLKMKDSQMDIYAVADSSALFQYLQTHDNALAFVPLSWVESILNNNIIHPKDKFEIISLTMNSGKEVTPDQYHLSDNSYPLSKGVYLNLKGNMADDASNFVNFCMKEVGQLIVLKTGLLPVDMPTRAYYVKDNAVPSKE